MIFEPAVGTALVELSMSSIPTPEKAYDSVTSGTIIAINPKDQNTVGNWLGRTAYWELYKDGVRPDKNHAFIKLSDIQGTSYEPTYTKA